MRETAAERLRSGDSIQQRLDTGATAVEIALADAVSAQAVCKAAWLARRYDPVARASIGADVLAALTPSMLEVVAALPSGQRTALLRRAADEKLTVRSLKAIVASITAAATVSAPVNQLGGAGQLAAASKAAGRYSSWDDRSLRTLLHGPSGDAVRSLATAGHLLASRIEEVTASEST